MIEQYFISSMIASVLFGAAFVISLDYPKYQSHYYRVAFKSLAITALILVVVFGGLFDTGRMSSVPYEDIVYQNDANMENLYHALNSGFSNSDYYIHMVDAKDIDALPSDSAISRVDVKKKDGDKYLVNLSTIHRDTLFKFSHHDMLAVIDAEALTAITHNIFLTYENDNKNHYIKKDKYDLNAETKHDDISFLKNIVKN